MISVLSLSALSLLWPAVARAQACVGSISSIDDVAAAVKCQTVNINAFTVPPNVTLNLSLLENATVNMLGNVTFGVFNWAGPLFQVRYANRLNGNGYFFDGNGPAYWDGLGGNGGVTKPHPMMKIKISGLFTKVGVINSPAHTFSISNPAPLTISHITIDNSLGDLPNAASGGIAAGHNTDGFDCSTTNLVIENSVILNQDDCIAINKGNNITFHKNTCSGGHGISVGSIDSNVVASNIQITGNTIINNDQALRIKTKAAAVNSTVTNITFSGNKATGCGRFGVIIDQSYSATLGTPGDGVALSNVKFVGTMNQIQVNSTAMRVAVNCGNSSCSGNWDWNKLNVTGGIAGPVNFAGITNWTQ
ncbi:endo-polygalacturonase PG1 [Ceratobasidium sp. AG-I]|nr:endo-polygalacturonase PG1 [Ceratobasidium sp. AG-I]